MTHRKVIAYHLIMTAYGFWLPNDPRGSWSDFVRAFELLRFGQATKVSEKRSHAYDPHDRERRLEAKKHLARNPVIFSGMQARAIGGGFLRYVQRSQLRIVACAIMPDHVHLVVLRHRNSIEMIGRLLKGDATRQLLAERIHPFQDHKYRDGSIPTPWARKQWSVFLSDHSAVDRAIRYTNDNPVRDGLKPQKWFCVNCDVESNR